METSPLICTAKSLDWFLFDRDLCHERVKISSFQPLMLLSRICKQSLLIVRRSISNTTVRYQMFSAVMYCNLLRLRETHNALQLSVFFFFLFFCQPCPEYRSQPYPGFRTLS